ncbi:hypothetical protein OCV51_10485 [Faecalicatena acetigenes]|uniref:Uncharacterized protein n=1 Tax=Faecalicatena acetigenes TaxID=2981790 RepID=A0ABT2TCQ6_9FIRM|nr:hypothetical protein [Faecalicatena acetigenes]MCU6748073.1 hypothetical protein [Faecalicatena acetigenes]SCI24248.1 Uncharacterised protein [uncultured Clostridium sp.]
MKLHFYILNEIYGSNPELTYSECEVVEKPKTYKPIWKFPYGCYRSFIKKEDVASLIEGNVVVLEEKDDKKAKEIFAHYFGRSIDLKKREIDKLEEKLKAINEFGEV